LPVPRTRPPPEAGVAARTTLQIDTTGDFLPDPAPLTEPAQVTDRHDPQVVHLDGLNLSRAWAWLRIGRALGDDDPTAHVAQEAARRHAQASLPTVLSGAYVGEHWLPTFAVLLTDVADEPPVAADHGVPPRR
jgi:hypothetical protein